MQARLQLEGLREDHLEALGAFGHWRGIQNDFDSGDSDEDEEQDEDQEEEVEEPHKEVEEHQEAEDAQKETAESHKEAEEAAKPRHAVRILKRTNKQDTPRALKLLEGSCERSRCLLAHVFEAINAHTYADRHIYKKNEHMLLE
eukprot:Skav210505  [mRNA]  locus=scaffold601:407139:409083:+ [translate_table: standard]